MDKFFDRFKPGGAKKKSTGGLNFGFSLPGQKFQGEGKSLGGTKPGRVIEIQLHEPGPLGVKVEKRPNGTAIVAMVMEGSQAEKAGMQRGDIICFQGSGGTEEVEYKLFLELAKANQRPVCFEIRRVETKTSASVASGPGKRTAEQDARKAAVIAAAEKREKAAKALTKKSKAGDKKNLPTLLSNEEKRRLEEERLSRMKEAEENQSEASKEAALAAKKNEAKTAAALGYNPYITNKVTSGQARNATVAATHGTIQSSEASTGSQQPSSDMAPLPTVSPPASTQAVEDTGSGAKKPSPEFMMAYEAVVTSNSNSDVVSCFGILRKLILNATTKGQGEDEAQAHKFRKIRLSNAKIKSAVVDIEGAFDLMLSVGFSIVEDEGESYLVFPKGFQGESWLSEALAMMEKYEKA